MDEAALEQHILDALPNVQSSENFGYKFFFYGDDHRMPFATIACADNDYEYISNLNRPGVFRLNLGVSKQTFQSLFGVRPVSLDAYDFAELNRFMPHPDYSRQFFICILNPSGGALESTLSLLQEAHAIAERRSAVRSDS